MTEKPKAKRGRKPGPRNPRGLATHKSGPVANAIAVRRAQQLEKRTKLQAEVWKLFTGRYGSFKKIADRLGISDKTAYEYCIAYRDRLDEKYGMADAALLRSRQQAAIDAIILAHWPNRKRKASADAIRDALAREAKLQGLDKRAKDSIPLEQVAALINGITRLFLDVVQDVELRRAFAAGMRSKVPQLTASGAIGVLDGSVAEEPAPDGAVQEGE